MGFCCSCGVTWRDIWTKEQAWERCSVYADVLRKMNHSTMRWFGHVERLESERLASVGSV